MFTLTVDAITLSASSIAENAGANAVVGTLSTTDPGGGNTFTYALVTGTGSTDNSAFNISGNQLQAKASFNFETKNSYSVRIRTTNNNNTIFFEKAFTITITDVLEAVEYNVSLTLGTYNRAYVIYDTRGAGGEFGNPRLRLKKGYTYLFNINAPGHPFWIKTQPSIGTEYAYRPNSTSGSVVFNGVSNGTIRFIVPLDAPDTLYYSSQNDSNMFGVFDLEQTYYN